MAPPAKSRKGKKAWRKNIDATEVENYLEEETYQQRRGPAAKELKDDQLFFVDKSADGDRATAVAEGKRPAKRRREEVAARPLRSQQIIAEAHKAKPVTAAPPTKKQTAAAAAATAAMVAASTAAAISGKKSADAVARTARAPALAAAKRAKAAAGRNPLDLWAEEDFGSDLAAAPGPGSAALAAAAVGKGRVEKKQGKGKPRNAFSNSSGASNAVAATTVRVMGPSARSLRSKAAARVKALAVDVPGCSFNPDTEQHQDAIALLVAAERKKELRREMMPSAPQDQVDAVEGVAPLTELEKLQVEAAESEEEEEAEEAAADPNAILLTAGDDDDDEEEEEEEEGQGRRKSSVKKSKKDRNKEARRKALDIEADGKRKLKAQRRELQTLRDVQAALAEEEAERELKRQRVAALREDRAAVEPPRLGKLRFEPTPVSVLLSEEKTGCLRQIVPCAMLAADRFKSLQQRGLVEPRKPQSFKERRKKVQYEKGARSEKEEAASLEVREMGRKNKKARKAAKAQDAATGPDDWA